MRLKNVPSTLRIAPPKLTFAATDERTLDKRRREMQPGRKLYNTARWRRTRLVVFRRDSFTCQMCGQIEGDPSKLHCDHIEKHNGNEQLFFDYNNLQTACIPCHNSTKQSQEKRAT
ncbi:MAG: HNH endonuclease signature motif containing protein [Pseudomonadota bacterium]